MDRLTQDVRVALRGFRRSPSFSITAVLILAIGIGMAVAMFAVFEAVLLRKLPVRDQDRVVELFTYRGDRTTPFRLLREDLPKVAATSRTMREVAGVVHWGALEGPFLDGDRALVVNRTLVTGNFFEVLGARPVLGRLIQPTDEAPGAEPVVVISHGTWQKQFGGDTTVIGRRLVEGYGRTRYRVIGVAPAGLDYPAGVGLWMPAWQPSDKLSVIAVARLAQDASPTAARSEFLATMNGLFPDRGLEGVHVETFTRAVVGHVRAVLVVLVGAVALLLLIACVNVGNLLLVRAAGRGRELSIRRALGATYGHMVRQLVVESAVLGIAAGVLGLLLATTLVDLLLALAPEDVPRTDVIRLAGAPVGITVGVTLLAVLTFGVVPALIASRGHGATPLRFDSRSGTESRTRRRARHALVAAQVALALVMLAGAGLLARSLERLHGIALGYEPEHLSLLHITFPPGEYNDAAGTFDQTRLNALGARILTALRSVPGVVAVTPALIPPFLGSHVFVARLDRGGQTPEEMSSNPFVPLEAGGADYFRTFGIPVLRGRAFTETDVETSAPVAIVSEAVARHLWPNDDPVGKRIRYWGPDTTSWRTVVGVAGDIRWRSLREATPTVYLPWRQAYWQGSFAVRTSAELSAVLPALRRAVHEVNPALALWDARTVDDHLAAPLAQPRLSALLLGAFALVSMLLAAIGLYGVMASVVRGSTRELGVRAALGASPQRLRRDVLRQALFVAGAGALTGLLAALATSQLLSSLLYGVSPSDPWVMLGSAMILLGVALVAAYVPARQATRVDPVQALRAD